jgi:hypothetical protein
VVVVVVVVMVVVAVVVVVVMVVAVVVVVVVMVVVMVCNDIDDQRTVYSNRPAAPAEHNDSTTGERGSKSRATGVNNAHGRLQGGGRTSCSCRSLRRCLQL